MKNYLYPLAIAAAVATGTFVVSYDAAIAGPTFTGVEGRNVAVSGYDAVSYFTDNGTPKKGDEAYRVSYKGADYYFSSASNAKKFKESPAKFAPQYGGHCAWAMSRGSLAPGDPLLSKVVDGKLYLNFSKNVQQTWLKDIPGFIVKADQKWPAIPGNKKFSG